MIKLLPFALYYDAIDWFLEEFEVNKIYALFGRERKKSNAKKRKENCSNARTIHCIEQILANRFAYSVYPVNMSIHTGDAAQNTTDNIIVNKRWQQCKKNA